MTVPEYLRDVVLILENPTQFEGAADRWPARPGQPQDELDDDVLIQTLPEIARRYEAMEKALDFVVDRENLMFAECTDAEQILDVCRSALAAARAPLEEKP